MSPPSDDDVDVVDDNGHYGVWCLCFMTDETDNSNFDGDGDVDFNNDDRDNVIVDNDVDADEKR